MSKLRLFLWRIFNRLFWYLTGCHLRCDHYRQCLAEKIVWWEQLRQTTPPPPIRWLLGRGHFIYDGQGICGVFIKPHYEVVLAWAGRFSTSAYAHECLHAAQLNAGIWDPKHERPEWGRIEEINKTLERHGL